MTNDTLNQNQSDEKVMHERIAVIDIKIMALKDAIHKLCLIMASNKKYRDTVLKMEKDIRELDKMKLQFNYIDSVLRDAKLQQQNKPLTIERK